MNFKHFYDLAKKSVSAWIDDYAPSMGAAISYYTVFSIAPLLIIVIAVAGFVWGREAVQGQIVDQLSGMIGKEGASGVQALIESANKPVHGLIATIISIGILILGATTVFAELQSSLDRIWNVPPEKKASGLWATLRARVLSLGFILGLGFLLAVSLVFGAGVAAFGSWVNGVLPGWEVALQLINIVISLAISTVLFAMIFKLMPQAKISWRDVWVGAVVTAVLFEVGKSLIGLYIGKSGVTSSFAAAGSLVVLLVWVYYSAQIFLLGAEFTWAYAHGHGSLAGSEAPAAERHGGQAGEKSDTGAQESAAAGGKAGMVSPSGHGATRSEIQPSNNEPVYRSAYPVPVANTADKVEEAYKPRDPGRRLASAPGKKVSRRPTLKQRAIAYGASVALDFALKLLLKKQAKKSGRRPAHARGRGLFRLR